MLRNSQLRCYSLSHGEVRGQILTSQAKFIIAHSSFLDTARKAVQDTQVKGIIQADGAKVLPGCIMSVERLAATHPATDLVRTPLNF